MTASTAAVADTSISATSTFFYLLIPALVLYFVYWKLQRRRFLELAEKIPGPKGYPIIGHGLDFLGNPLRKSRSDCLHERDVGIRAGVCRWFQEYNSVEYFVFIEILFTKSFCVVHKKQIKPITNKCLSHISLRWIYQ